MLYFARRIPWRNFTFEPRILRRGLHYKHSDMFLTQFAQDWDLQYRSETTETERINDMLKYYGLQKWGFIVYRCRYNDNDAWDRIMHHLNARKDTVLKNIFDDDCLAQHLDWNVQQDLSLNYATKDQVRDRFGAWVATYARAEMPTSASSQERLEGLLYENPRYKYCIHVDADSMQSVLDGPSPAEPELCGVGYVNLIRVDQAWEAWEKESTQVPATEGRDNYQDEGEPEVEGRTSFDVGWMKVSVDGLVPEIYEALVNDKMWDAFYVRPNEGARKR